MQIGSAFIRVNLWLTFLLAICELCPLKKLVLAVISHLDSDLMPR
jgi:hypothetical protein